MDDFFDGLDCKLRVSGMVADSIMMGIVNSAMEKAFDKVCSNEGVIERLNEKSRFCELAVMQLEWCLKFVQEETDSFVVESSCEREKLVSDLTETRDRIQRRLEETEFAISEKDRELVEGMENESILRKALELRDRELSSLRANLESIPNNRVGMDEGRDGDFGELKNSVDQQFWNIKQKLEDERMNLTNGMRKMSQGQIDSDVVEERNCSDATEMDFYEKNKGGEIIRPQNCSLRPELNIGFEQMGSDIDILKETLDLAFGMMDSAISLSEVGPMEQQWRWTVEKDITSVVLGGFLKDLQDKDLQVNSSVEVREGSRQVPMGGFSREDWSELMTNISSLCHELELFFTLNEVQPKSFHIDVGHKVSSQKEKPKSSLEDKHGLAHHQYGKSDNVLNKNEEPLEEDPSGNVNLVAKMIKSHESIIWRKSEELNLLKTEIHKEKGCPSLRKGDKHENPEKRIHNIILRLDNFIKRNAELSATFDDYIDVHEKDKLFPQNSLSKSDLAEKKDIIHPLKEAPEKVGNVSVCCSVNEKLTDEIRQLKQEREYANFQAFVMEETNVILFKGFVKEFHLKFYNYDTENLIKEDICKIFFREMVKEWSSEIENYKIGSQVKEEMHQIVCSEAVTGFGCSHGFPLKECQDVGYEGNFQEDSPYTKFFQDIEGLIREDVYTVFLQEMVKEWNLIVERYEIKCLVKQEMDWIVFNATIKDKMFQNLEGVITENIYTVFLKETVKEWNMAIENYETKSLVKQEMDWIVFNATIKDTMFQNLEGVITENVYTVFLKEMVKKWNMTIEDYNRESLFNEEMYQIVFGETIKDFETISKTRNPDILFEDLTSTNMWFQSLESLVREDVCTGFFREIVKEWKMNIEIYYIESLIREDVHRVVISEAVKDVNTLLKESEARKQDNFLEYLPSAYSVSNSSEVIEKENLMKKLDSISKCFEAEEILMLTATSEIIERNVHTDVVSLKHEQLEEQGLHFEEMLNEKDEILGSVSKKLEKRSSLGIAVGDLEEVNDQMTPIKDTLQNSDQVLCLLKENETEKITPLASPLTSLAEFPQILRNFELIVHEKIGVNILRLTEVERQLNPLVEFVSSLKKKELLYRKAFTRRCYDLQKAEAEVDLLGDEVDILLGLLEKIYITLDHYSPILQHYFGVKDLLRLIKKELSGPATHTSR